MDYSELGIIIDTEHLAAFAENTARSLHPDTLRSGRSTARAIREDLHRLKRAHTRLERQTDTVRPGQAGEWLLDNWYLAVQAGEDAVRAFRWAKDLPAAGGTPRICLLADSLLRAGAGAVDTGRCRMYLRGFQQAAPLRRAEQGLFVPALNAAAVHALAELYHDGEPDGERAGALFTTLRLLCTLDLSALIEEENPVEQLLRLDPAGVYPAMAEETRDEYRRQVAVLAKKWNMDEYRVARRVLRLSRESRTEEERHVGYFLFRKPMGRRAAPRRGTGYVAVFLLSTLFLSLLAGFTLRSPWAAVLLLIPVSEVVKNLMDFLLTRHVRPRHVPRMELPDGIPDEGVTVCVISALLTGPESGREAAARLEEFHLANRDCGDNLLMGILADLPESPTASAPGDDPALLAAKSAVDGLNRKYGGGFYLFYRERTYDERDGRWRGRERKRGALLALAGLMEGQSSGLITLAGDPSRIRGARFILTLDGDTRLCPGTARELAGAMLHPLNRPAIDEATGTVTAGYGLLHPRIAVDLTAATATDFARIFAGQGGTDPYGGACGELYMDLFDRGGFAGKGILSAEALLACSAQLPDGRILSHDALEGALLHGGCLWTTEVTDGFPATPMSYMKRLERWTRGDWQNAPWVFTRRGRALTDMDRFKLFDSLRRSLVAPATLICLVCGFLRPDAGALAAWTAFLALISRLLLTLAEESVRPEQEVRTRYHSTILHGVKGSLLTVSFRLLLLPWEAWVTFSAICRALWRMLVSKRGLLAWETFAQTSGKKSGPAALVRAMAPSLILGAALVVLPGTVIGKAAGILWLLSPLAAMGLSRPRKQDTAPAPGDRAYLTARAAEIWRFFTDFCTAEDHFLPPDNVQEQPPKGAAHRTSPTNIGLAMTSALTAGDLGLDGDLPAEEFIARILTTLESLPKWHGHLYNWYDTCTLKPLTPVYVSTVDSGNLAAALLTVAAGMEEYGRADLADRAMALFDTMDFSPLYDPARHLFYIGMDLTAGKPSQGWYDLLSSEARLTGFVAIAKGDVPRRHWRRLSRAQVAKDGYRGMVSWSGSMFEYLMPELFLPLCPDSLLYETAKFCVDVQRRRPPRHIPWGVSESAYFSLDTALNYRYKAHGCAALALKRGMDEELVISPYSTFLTLPIAPAAAMKNLRRLEKLGALGQYGFYEALDFTPERCRMHSGETVRCFMAHHLGMSMTAIGNYLRTDIHVRRFLSHPAMAAHRCLLEEKVPIGGTVLRRRTVQPPARPERSVSAGWSAGDGRIDWEHPVRCILSNGSYALLADETGPQSAASQDVTIYRAEQSAMAVVLDGTAHALFPVPEAPEGRSWQFTSVTAAWSWDGPALSARTTLAVDAGERGEIRTVELTGKREVPGELMFSLEPVLAFSADFQAHPAFCRLGLRAQLRDGTLLIRRAPRGRLTALYLAVSCSQPFTVSPLGDLSDPALTLRVPFRLEPGSTFDARFTLCTAPSAAAAVEGSRRMLAVGPDRLAALPESAAVLLGMSGADMDRTMDLLRELAHPACTGTVPGKRALLWQYGISGDLPIVLSHLTGPEDLDAAVALIRQHAMLSLCGAESDLVLLCAGAGDYRRPSIRELETALAKLGLEDRLGVKGGVHLLSDESLIRSTVEPFASKIIGLHATSEEQSRSFDLPFPTFHSASRTPGTVPEYGWTEDAFAFTVRDTLPVRAWSDLLTNGMLGYAAADSGLGHLWYGNAGLFRLTVWDNDPRAVAGPETLEYLPEHGAPVSLFAANDGLGCRVTFGFGWTQWEKTLEHGTVTVTAFIPEDRDARVLILRSDLPGGAFRWRADLLLGEHPRDGQTVETFREGACLCARNPASVYPDMVFRAVCDPPFDAFTCARDSARMGRWDEHTGTGALPCFCARIPASGTAVLVCGCGEAEELLALTQPEAAYLALEETKRRWTDTAQRFTLDVPDETAVHAMNGWAVYQSLACRMLGRSSLYQAGGAFGFRDQLQDAVNLILIDPSIARQQILACCARQYREGDVQHWWHLPEGRGVRTRCSDDLLWLPWALCEYVDKTGDTALCDLEAAYLESPPLADGEADRYELARAGEETGTVLDHARRALDRVIARGEGEHGLLLMLGGDWNDGLGAVGREGRGESVWLSWFFAHVSHRFGTLCDRLGQADGEKYRRYARRYGDAADRAWDGGWYLRGYYDDGAPLGSKDGESCRIDSIAQSWAILSGFGDEQRRSAALDNALHRLFDREAGLVKLFDPPIPPGNMKAGYISGYGPGFRENGGQYTHAAIWLAQACLRAGRTDDGWAILKTLWPDDRDPSVFEGEPFVIPADVSSNPDHTGACGWTWYTGSAGWYFRVFTEDLLGIRLEDGCLTVTPRLPTGWDGYTARLRDGADREHTITVRDGTVTVDGAPPDPGDPVKIFAKEFV